MPIWILKAANLGSQTVLEQVKFVQDNYHIPVTYHFTPGFCSALYTNNYGSDTAAAIDLLDALDYLSVHDYGYYFENRGHISNNYEFTPAMMVQHVKNGMNNCLSVIQDQAQNPNKPLLLGECGWQDQGYPLANQFDIENGIKAFYNGVHAMVYDDEDSPIDSMFYFNFQDEAWKQLADGFGNPSWDDSWGLFYEGDEHCVGTAKWDLPWIDGSYDDSYCNEARSISISSSPSPSPDALPPLAGATRLYYSPAASAYDANIFNSVHVVRGDMHYKIDPMAYGANVDAGASGTLIIEVRSLLGSPQMELVMWNPNDHADYWWSVTTPLEDGVNTMSLGPNSDATYIMAAVVLGEGDMLEIVNLEHNGDVLVDQQARPVSPGDNCDMTAYDGRYTLLANNDARRGDDFDQSMWAVDEVTGGNFEVTFNDIEDGSNVEAGGTGTLVVDVASIAGTPMVALHMFNPDNHEEHWHSGPAMALAVGINELSLGPNVAATFIVPVIMLGGCDEVEISRMVLHDVEAYNGDDHSGGGSDGAAIGAGVGVTVAVLAMAGAGAFVWKRKQQQAALNVDISDSKVSAFSNSESVASFNTAQEGTEMAKRLSPTRGAP